MIEITPAMSAEIERQAARFTPADLTGAVRAWRQIRAAKTSITKADAA